MANIIGLKQQEKALAEINTILKTIITVNEFLAAEVPSGEFQILCKDAQDQKLKPVIQAPKKDVDELFKKYKEDRKEHILKLAQEYKIALDPEDEEILGIKTE